MAEINVSMKITDMPEFKRIIAAIEEEKKSLWTDEEVITLINDHVSDWCDEGKLREYKIAMGKLMP